MAASSFCALSRSSAIGTLWRRIAVASTRLNVCDRRFQSSEAAVADGLKGDHKTETPSTRVAIGDKVCITPKEAKTNLLGFLTQSDLQKRAKCINIPFFVAGSSVAVTRTDPYSKNGQTRFVGICISRHNKDLGSNFILRNVVNGYGVEVRFDLYSPLIQKIEVLKLQRRVRAKLYYLRDKTPKESTVNENMKPVKTTKMSVFRRRRVYPKKSKRKSKLRK